MNYILFDGEYRDNLLPLTYTKPVADLTDRHTDHQRKMGEMVEKLPPPQ